MSLEKLVRRMRYNSRIDCHYKDLGILNGYTRLIRLSLQKSAYQTSTVGG